MLMKVVIQLLECSSHMHTLITSSAVKHSMTGQSTLCKQSNECFKDVEPESIRYAENCLDRVIFSYLHSFDAVQQNIRQEFR